MRVPDHVVQERRDRVAELLRQHRYLPVKELCRRLGISEATARRDLAALEDANRIKRTYGGALMDFDSRFPSFAERLSQSEKAKRAIADAAVARICSEMTCYLDTGTTVFAVADALGRRPDLRPVRVVTGNLPVADRLVREDGIDVFLLAGQFLGRQSVLLGEPAMLAAEYWNFDLGFLGAEGMDAEGIWNSDPKIVEFQRKILTRSREHIFCMDGSKLGKRTDNFLVRWDEVDGLITDLDAETLQAAQVQPLRIETVLRGR